jgi:CheY-like chemotaxis protein
LTEIFAAFAQTKSGAAAGGTGLGLAICDRLITRMNGQLQVASTLGTGSRFWFELPLVSGRPAARSELDDVESELPPFNARLAPGQAVTAMVVDDTAANRHILASLLESAGVRVVVAADGLEAIARAQTDRPQIIFMDLKMTGLDGIEATRRLTRDPVTSSIPIVAVTASALGNSRQRARDAGCVDYLAKAYDSSARRLRRSGWPRASRRSIGAATSADACAARSRSVTSARSRSLPVI